MPSRQPPIKLSRHQAAVLDKRLFVFELPLTAAHYQ